MEKVKGIYGDPKWGKEIKQWLIDNGAVNNTYDYDCDLKDVIYYVDDNQSINVISSKDAKKFEHLFDIVKLTTPIKDSQEKRKILKYFANRKCEDCAFTKECDGIYDEMRMHTTDALTLCEILHMSYLKYRNPRF